MVLREWSCFVKPSCLMVIIPDCLSLIVKKGEITPRYYNPGDLFDEVHIVMTNDDKVNPGDLQKTVGRAKLYLHNLPSGKRLFLQTLGYRPRLLNRWAEAGVQLARQIRPDLIRCHGNTLNGFVAVRIKQELGVPVIISLHGNPDIDLRGPVAKSFREKIYAYAHKAVELTTLRYADHFIAVYKPIVPYLRRNQVRKYSLIYNAVGYGVKPKSDYQLHQPVRFLCVGRQQARFKEPANIVKAVAELPGVELVLIGTGDLHDYLMRLARELNCDDRCKFIAGLGNDQVLNVMRDADIYVFNQISSGISKTIIEAALTGLPIIVNKRPGRMADELDGDWLIQVEDTKDGYLQALRKLLSDQKEREQLGRRAMAHAQAHWAPEKMEARVVEIYRKYMRPG